MNTSKTVIFDFDGTIADSTNVVINVLMDVAKKRGLEIDLKDINKYRDISTKELVKQLNIPIYQLPNIQKRIGRELDKNIGNVKMFHGLKEVPMKLNKEGIVLGILTSNSEKNVDIFLKRTAVGGIFDFVYSGSSIFGKGKVFSKLLKKEKIDRRNVIYVGDDTRDIEAAKEVGVRSIAVTWGFNTRIALSKVNPDWLISKPKELLQVLG